MTQAEHADVDEVQFFATGAGAAGASWCGWCVPPSAPAVELVNVLRLMFFGLASHRCPNGHYHALTMAVAAGLPLHCEICGAEIHAPGAEMLAFNSTAPVRRARARWLCAASMTRRVGARPHPEHRSGAVVPWRTFGFNTVQPGYRPREFGVR